MLPSKKKFPRRCVSAVRDFPPGCGKKNYQKCQKPIDCSSSNTSLNQVVRRPFVSNSTITGNTIAKRVRREDEVQVQPQGSRDAFNRNLVTPSARNKVRKTLRLFQMLCRNLLRDEETKKSLGSRSRVDLASVKILRESNKLLNSGKQILGNVPGVEVGDEFQYRVELYIVGLHHQYQGGIDTMIYKGKSVASSIVSSGRYGDFMDSSDVLVYTGQGGIPIPGSKIKVATDQKLERGNLALKNSMDEQTPVRVIRGFKEASTLTYDGLYIVEKCWKEKGDHDTYVFKFQLRKIPGQPDLAIRELNKSISAREREDICVSNISQGKEKMPIAAVNTLDKEKPPPFKYLVNMIHPRVFNPTPPRGCGCVDGCSSSMACSCATKNGGQFPFNRNGAIVDAKPLVYECGPRCSCPPSCHNRVSQHGIKFQLEVFKTETKGWGVRSLTSIPSGAFVCEYTGELLQDIKAEERTGRDEYLFDIGNNYTDHTLWEGLSNVIPAYLKSTTRCDAVEDAGFFIDATQYGNVGRFINHSCSPNLYAQNVLYDHDDKRMPHIMLFAAENIPPLQELTYHYNHKIHQVCDSNGDIRKNKCYCGSMECTGRIY